MIPAEAVHAAARSFYGSAWDDVSSEDLKYALDQMRETLEAAAPYILAEAWDEGMEAMYATTSSEWPPIPELNPHRPHP